jgi:hypothetical protein
VNLSPECVTAVVLLVLASANQLWCAGRARRAVRPVLAKARHRMRIANRLVAAALLADLFLGAVATVVWAAASIGGSAVPASPPLLWPLTLFVAGLLVSIVANAVAGPGPGIAPGQQTAPPFTGTEERQGPGPGPQLGPGTRLGRRRLLRPVRRAVR